ncbi:growth/differentiation factor 8-like [Tachypleus tridentatus]|uniref:growth/differentiation factor 8-like n=1 Tax=Tachypleus tridentatus TaxID=6853 RepID=UPI003FD0E10F
MSLSRDNIALYPPCKILVLLMCLVIVICISGMLSLTEETLKEQENDKGKFLEMSNLTVQDLMDSLFQQQEKPEQQPRNPARDSVEEAVLTVVNGSRKCHKCLLMEQEKEKRLDIIKAQILNKLGMNRPPNVTRRNQQNIPPLINLIRSKVQSDLSHFQYEQSQSNEHEKDTATPDLAFAFATSDPFDYLHIPAENVLHFIIPDKVMNSQLRKVHLWVHMKHLENYKKGGITVHINQVVQDIESYRLLEFMVKNINLRRHRGDWIKLNIHKVVSHWIHHPKENLGLVVEIDDNMGNIFPITNSSWIDNEAHRPFIEIEMKKPLTIRSKRNIDGLECDLNSNEIRCCRYPLTVDFIEFEWDWIIAPRRYEANYCSGECPFVFLQRYPHTHIVQQVDPNGSISPCCAPSEVSTISMLYYEDNSHIILGYLPGMLVKRCGCS